MLTFETERQIAIFDVDGVIVENPPESWGGNNTITDPDFWSKHWLHPEKAKLQMEMVTLAQSLISTGVHVIFMTARPETYRASTVQLLRRAGFMVGQNPPTHISAMSVRPFLVMMPGGAIVSSAAWKQNNVAFWKASGAKIMLFVEDYRWNCEAIRSIVPVLLYERKKISNRVLTGFPCCGGMTQCWCSLKEANDERDLGTTPEVGSSSGTHRA